MIDTARMTLRPLTLADFDDVHDYYSRPVVARYLYWEATTPEQTREALARNAERIAIENEGDGLVLGMVPHDVGRVVGQVSLGWTSREHRQGEVGFIVNPAHQGSGLATEAAAAMLDHAFDKLALHRVDG